jgi:hypothetical protein
MPSPRTQRVQPPDLLVLEQLLGNPPHFVGRELLVHDRDLAARVDLDAVAPVVGRPALQVLKSGSPLGEHRAADDEDGLNASLGLGPLNLLANAVCVDSTCSASSASARCIQRWKVASLTPA